MIRHSNYKDITYKHYDNVFMSTEKYPDYEELNPEYEKFQFISSNNDSIAIDIAESLAYQLGYAANYLDGGTLYPEDYEAYLQAINSLVGEVWPEKVNEAHERGLEEGYWDT